MHTCINIKYQDELILEEIGALLFTPGDIRFGARLYILPFLHFYITILRRNLARTKKNCLQKCKKILHALAAELYVRNKAYVNVLFNFASM